jgi:hypothetical protein
VALGHETALNFSIGFENALLGDETAVPEDQTTVAAELTPASSVGGSTPTTTTAKMRLMRLRMKLETRRIGKALSGGCTH